MPEDHAALKQIDKDLTKILTTIDQQCAKFKTSLWSPKLHHIYLEHQYWMLMVSKLLTGNTKIFFHH